MTDAPVGLRSIKKQLTRESIADAALRLSLEKGLAHITIDEIAHQAFVSPRTVSNYFSCKEEAVVAAGSTLPGLIALFARAPSGLSPMASMRQTVSRFFGTLHEDELEQTRQWLRLIEANPSLGPYQMASYDRAERDVRLIIAEREGIEDGARALPGAGRGHRDRRDQGRSRRLGTHGCAATPACRHLSMPLSNRSTRGSPSRSE